MPSDDDFPSLRLGADRLTGFRRRPDASKRRVLPDRFKRADIRPELIDDTRACGVTKLDIGPLATRRDADLLEIARRAPLRPAIALNHLQRIKSSE